MKIRVLVAAAVAAVPALSSVAPAHAWECNRMEACQRALMTACRTVAEVTTEHNCQ